MRYCVIYWHIPRDWKNPTDMNNSMQRSVLTALYISAEYKLHRNYRFTNKLKTIVKLDALETITG